MAKVALWKGMDTTITCFEIAGMSMYIRRFGGKGRFGKKKKDAFWKHGTVISIIIVLTRNLCKSSRS